MGWREFRGWRRELIRRRKAEMEAQTADPESWDGAENDPFWEEQRRIQREMRGR